MTDFRDRSLNAAGVASDANNWWLRSANSNNSNYAGNVNNNGKVNDNNNVNNNYGVAPA